MNQEELINQIDLLVDMAIQFQKITQHASLLMQDQLEVIQDKVKRLLEEEM